jgi:CBS domain-containing protein
VLERLFHRVNRVIPETQEVVTVDPSTAVGEALQLLNDNRFSQVPVVRGLEVLGSFSYRSFAHRAVQLQQGHGPLEELPVEEFLEDLEIARATEELTSIFPALDRDDAVLIGGPDDLQAIVAPMDVLRYLYRLTNPTCSSVRSNAPCGWWSRPPPAPRSSSSAPGMPWSTSTKGEKTSCRAGPRR